MSTSTSYASIDPTTSNPELLDDERVLSKQKGSVTITLQEHAIHEQFDVQRVWATTHRLIFSNGTAVDLRRVVSFEAQVRVGLWTSDEFRGKEYVLGVLHGQREWQCQVCRHVNTHDGSTCALCGAIDPNPVEDGAPCPSCTYMNERTAKDCIICGAHLTYTVRVAKLSRSVESAVRSAIARREWDGPSEANDAADHTSTSPPPTGHMTPISSLGRRFRGLSTLSANTSSLRRSRSRSPDLDTDRNHDSDTPSPSSASTPSGPSRMAVGIGGIVHNVEAKSEQRQTTIKKAFKDLDNLMANASSLVKLAKDLDARIKRNETTGSSDEQAAVQQIVKDLGITSVSTKDQAGDQWHKELARELGVFLSKCLDDRFGGILLLSELYCVFNRARAADLVSPDDLTTACTQFPHLGIPVRLREFESGAKIVQSSRFTDDAMLTRLETFLDEPVYATTGVTPLQVSEHETIPIILAQEFLKIGVTQGRLCVFRQIGAGERFFKNLFPGFTPVT